MKIAIVYRSLTGNTRLLAEALREALSGESIVYFGEPRANIEAELYLVGSWTDKGSCDREIADFLKGLKNRRVAYFGTAGFGGSEAYYQAIASRVRDNLSGDNALLGTFFCQGKMPPAVKRRYETMLSERPGDARLLKSLENFDAALPHPDAADLRNAKSWALSLL